MQISTLLEITHCEPTISNDGFASHMLHYDNNGTIHLYESY